MKYIPLMCLFCVLLLSCKQKVQQPEVEAGSQSAQEQVEASVEQSVQDSTQAAESEAVEPASDEEGIVVAEPEASVDQSDEAQSSDAKDTQAEGGVSEDNEQSDASAEERDDAQVVKGPYGFNLGKVYVKRENGKVVAKFRVEDVGEQYIETRWYDLSKNQWNDDDTTQLVKEQVEVLQEEFLLEE